MRASAWAIWMVVFVLAGCATYTQPVGPQQQLTPAQQNFENLWQASIDVLEDYYFVLDRRDRRAGVLATELMVGKHWFEFWRRDAVTPYDFVESSIQTVYRVAEVQIAPSESDPGTFEPHVTVYYFRSDAKMYPVTSTSEAYDIYLFGSPGDQIPGTLLLERLPPESRAAAEGYFPVPTAGMPPTIVPLGPDGRDHPLEEQMRQEILVRCHQLTAITPQSRP